MRVITWIFWYVVAIAMVMLRTLCSSRHLWHVQLAPLFHLIMTGKSRGRPLHQGARSRTSCCSQGQAGGRWSCEERRGKGFIPPRSRRSINGRSYRSAQRIWWHCQRSRFGSFGKVEEGIFLIPITATVLYFIDCTGHRYVCRTIRREGRHQRSSSSNRYWIAKTLNDTFIFVFLLLLSSRYQ